MRSRRKTALACALLLSLGACAGSTPEPDAEAPRTKTTAKPVLRVAVVQPDSIDPMKASSRGAVLVVKQICDSLVGADPETGRLVPAVAESWTASADAKKFTFKLRSGVKFHNGRELVAEDYVWSMSRFAGPKSGSKEHFLLERIAGYQEVLFEKSPTLKGVKALDPRTLEIELATPFAEFPAIMSNPLAGAAIPKEAVEASPEAFAAKPVCTGPYVVDQPWEKQSEISLSRFSDYYAANEAFREGGKASTQKLQLKIVATEQAGFELLEQSEVDVADLPVSGIAKAKKMDGSVASDVNGHVAYIGFPVRKPPFDNLAFRTALALSIDRQAVVSDLLGDSRQSPRGFLPDSAGPVAALSQCSDIVGSKPDLSEAKASLATSGVDPASVNLSVHFNSSGGHERWLTKVTEQWNSGIGIQSSLKPQEWTKYLEFLVKPGADGPFRLAWPVRFPSPEALYDPLFSTGSLDNYTGFSNPEFDDLLKKARETVDDKSRYSIYAEAGRVLCKELPIAPMWFGESHVAFGKGVEPVEGKKELVLDLGGHPTLREMVSRT